MAAAAVCLAVVCVQTYRKNRTESEMERLAESTMVSGAVSGSSDSPQAEDISETGAFRETGTSQGAGSTSGADAAAERGAASGNSVAPGRDSYIQTLADMGIPIPEKQPDFGVLQETVNEDIYAWIYIPDTKIDYPVLQHPEDNYYYLNHNLDGSRGYPGCIYTEDYNTRDFLDPNTVIYGHNMKNGSMFAGLHLFEDSEYFEEHPYVYIYTEDGLYVYEIFAAYESGNEHILYNNDFSDDYAFLKYLSDIMNGRTMNGNLKEDVTLTSEDRIITLSTCVAGKPDRRYLVQGVLLNEN